MTRRSGTFTGRTLGVAVRTQCHPEAGTSLCPACALRRRGVLPTRDDRAPEFRDRSDDGGRMMRICSAMACAILWADLWHSDEMATTPSPEEGTAKDNRRRIVAFQWSAGRGRIIASVVALCSTSPVALHGQSVATVRIDAASVSAMSAGGCAITTTARSATAPVASGAVIRDSLLVVVRKNDSSDDPGVLPMPVEIRLNKTLRHTIEANRKADTVVLEAGELRDGVLELALPNTVLPFCRAALLPSLPPLGVARGFTTHTDVIASGEVSNAIRTGALNNQATGSLGFHHQTFPASKSDLRRFPLVFLDESVFEQDNRWGRFLRATNFVMDGQDLRAVITVAGTVDSVRGKAGPNFARSVLLPTVSSTGGGKSVDLEYFPHAFGHHRQAFGPDIRFTASESRWAPDDTGGIVFQGRTAVLMALDVRLKAILINRVSETDDNSLSFAIDGGYISRWIGGDVTAPGNERVLVAALGPGARTHFTGYAFGTQLRLRQVTAFADLQCVSCQFAFFGGRETSVESLEGLQPVIGFRFEAPFFTVGP